MQVKDKVVIVTGASGGIGLATARLFSKENAKVALVARSLDKLEKFSKELLGSLAIKADMSKEPDIKQMVDKVKNRFGGVDVLINNAGQGYDAPVEKIDPEIFKKIFELNVLGSVIAMQQVIPIMRKRGAGVVVNISSGTALMNLPTMSPYSSSKKALVGISLTGRAELESDNIKICVVYPYITATDFEKHTVKTGIDESNEEESGDGPPFPPDSAEFVAEKILDAVVSERAETFAHEWMGKR